MVQSGREANAKRCMENEPRESECACHDKREGRVSFFHPRNYIDCRRWEYQYNARSPTRCLSVKPSARDSRSVVRIDGPSGKIDVDHDLCAITGSKGKAHRRRADNIFASALIWPFCTFRGDSSCGSPASRSLLPPSTRSSSVALVAAS